jgi:hypothetical protein
MQLPPQLLSDVESLREDGYTVDVIPDGNRYYIVFRRFRLPGDAYAPPTVDLMVMTDYQYPVSRMDMFWTNPVVLRQGGAFPQSAASMETYGGISWQRWSWHYPTWDPSKHSLRTHFEAVRDRLLRGL